MQTIIIVEYWNGESWEDCDDLVLGYFSSREKAQAGIALAMTNKREYEFFQSVIDKLVKGWEKDGRRGEKPSFENFFNIYEAELDRGL